MPFINRYNKDTSYNYNNAKKLGGYLYVIGSIETDNWKGMVSKLNENGDIVWEKSYSQGSATIIFHDIIECDNGDLLLAGNCTNTTNTFPFLQRIDPDGNVIWSKLFGSGSEFYYFEYNGSSPFVRVDVESYVFVLRQPESDPNYNYSLEVNTLIKINQNGDVTGSRKLVNKEHNYFIHGLQAFGNKVIAYGSARKVNFFESPSSGLVIEFNLSLVPIRRFIIPPINVNVDQSITNVIYTNQYMIFAGSSYFIKYALPSGGAPVVTSQRTISVETIYGASSIAHNDDFIYVEHTNKPIREISKLNHNLEVIFSKRFATYTGGHNLITQVLPNETVLLQNQYGETQYGNNVGFLGITNLELNCCFDQLIPNAVMTDVNLNGVIETNFTTSVPSVPFLPIAISPDVFPSSKEVVCLPNTLSPCVTDPDVCGLYSSVSAIMTGCLQNPADLNDPDYKKFVECIKAIVSQIDDFSTKYPEYGLQSQLSASIKILEIFMANPNAENYENAWNALQFIISLLSQTGNCNCENTFTIKENVSIQSGDLYLQAAGSVGDDSAKGIHLRWTLKGALEGHLPKGNYATSTANFNKTNDFVRIYRTPYVENKVLLDLSASPTQVNETPASKNWGYAVGSKFFHVHFRNTARYNYVRNQLGVDPLSDSLAFLKNYGDSLIEIENKTELSFAVTPVFIETNSPSAIKLELLSVAENKISAAKGASLRNTYALTDLNYTKLVSENIRSVRFRAQNAHISSVEFEFYTDLIFNASQVNAWDFLGRFALTTASSVAFERLEPQPNVLSNWLRYKEGDLTNVENYKTKWNGSSVTPENRIEQVVMKYIALSDAADNPLALETVSTQDDDDVAACLAEGNPEYTPNTTPTQYTFEVSNLHILQMGSLDYHVARMLGLGHLDLDPNTAEGQYVYLSDYHTVADLQDGLGVRPLQHIYCSLPTSLSDQRLPIPVTLNRIENGLFYEPEVDPEDPEPSPETTQLTDENGLSLDGMTQFYTLFSDMLPEEAVNAPFYYKDDIFISSEVTVPVYAGLKYRLDSEVPDWRRPGLAYDPAYFNADLVINETKPILIPEPGKPIYIHRQRISGTYEYTSYGINWFNRASILGEPIAKTTLIKAMNTLLPPTNIVATLIQEERPLLLTTAAEQEMLKAIPTGEDRTLVRLTFEYNHAQEMVDYHHKIDGEPIEDYMERQHELFADDIRIKFRDHAPLSVSGKVKHVLPGSNAVLSIIETDIFPIYSSGIDTSVQPQTVPPTYNEQIVPVMPPGAAQHFIGSVFLVDGVGYVIHDIDTSSLYPRFTVFKSDISGALVNLTTQSDPTNLIEPAADSLFVVVENMQNEPTWGAPNPANAFNVHIDLTTEHREPEIIVTSTDCSTNTYVQKFRGVFESAKIEKIVEKLYNSIDQDGNPANDPTVKKHVGLYKVTFPGFHLDQHSQYRTDRQNSVEWYNGIARLHTWNDDGFDPGYRKNFKVVRTENIGTTSDLVLYIEDLTFPKDVFSPDYAATLAAYKGKVMPDNVMFNVQYVNYYPGYKVYLYKDPALSLVQENVLPSGDDDVRYTIFGLRSHDNPNEFPFDNTEDFLSPFSVPAVMFAQAVKEPVQPQKPSGGMYATRPDYFGKSSYTFETVYGPTNNPTPPHKPHSVQFNRASDVQFLGAIYDNSVAYDPLTHLPIRNTVDIIQEDIFQNGDEDFYVDRWNNLLGFDYNYTNEVPNDPLFPDENGRFRYFQGRRLPMPDNIKFIDAINDFIDAHNQFYSNQPSAVGHLTRTVVSGSVLVTFGGTELKLDTVIIPEVLNPDNSVRNGQLLYRDFLRDVLLNCFVPLTEVPVIYDYVKTGDYQPIPKKQVVRDRNGQLLPPSDPAFDMAPMASRKLNSANRHSTRFTDFGLDGASNAKYFYAVREINKQMKTSPYSAILGPVSLVNTAPPTAPEILRIIPVLENRVLNTPPSVQLEINSYPKAHNIRKISIYRADNAEDALSVRTMKLVKVIDLDTEGLTDESKWVFTDDFSDLPEVPYGDILFYRLTVSRIIKYNDATDVLVVDYTPSEASRLVMTNIVENYSPPSPEVKYQSEPLLPAASQLEYIILNWNETAYKGNYFLFKMNTQGNWVEIARVAADRLEKGKYHVYTSDGAGVWTETGVVTSVNNRLYLKLVDTDFNTSSLNILSADGTKLYHHFKVIAENTAGMRSREERILTIYNEVTWAPIGGIAPEDRSQGMIVGNTFIVR
ncbi:MULTISPECIES: hypothetical protein [unclassified Flavobacterium]|uniref:hypothetical protein n=1 Tax=unclassified Flavobacterium TaxID=196869 RepID=UPI001F148DA2|nr:MULTISPECIES: hypothetical protein [unclassified Flavobacterium]UMY66135.1 hypothetical protein MKO97_01785 [Flavobacterium sp. HJ-32-4]